MKTEELRQHFPKAGKIEVIAPTVQRSRKGGVTIQIYREWASEDYRCDIRIEGVLSHVDLLGGTCSTEAAAIRSLAREVRKFGERIRGLTGKE